MPLFLTKYKIWRLVTSNYMYVYGCKDNLNSFYISINLWPFYESFLKHSLKSGFSVSFSGEVLTENENNNGRNFNVTRKYFFWFLLLFYRP